MSQNDRAYSEKRDFIRMRLDAPVTLRHNGAELAGVCVDLSSTGMQVEADSTLPMGAQVRVSIRSSHSELSGLDATTEVVRVQDLGGGRQSLGLSILSMC